MRAFLDTGPLYARINKRDPDHQSVMDFLQKMLSGQVSYRTLITTNYIIDEAVTFTLYSTRRHDLAADVLNLIENSAIIQVEWITEEREQETRNLFRRLTDKEFSFTDVSSFVVMKELGIADALTFDHHFTQIGFNRLL